MDHAATSTGGNGNVDTQRTRDYASHFKTTRTFKSKEDLKKWAREVGRLNDFVIVTLRSDSGEGNKRPRVTLGCERSGKCDRRSTPKKTMTDKYGRGHTGTKKCGCPFRLMGKKQAAGDEWELMVVVGWHNHALGDLEEGHSFAGKLSQEEKSLLKGMSERGVQPKEMLTTLKQRDKHNKSTPRTIYNGCQRLTVLRKLEYFRFWFQRFMCKASEYNYIEKHRLNPKTDTVWEFFLTHPTSLELLSAFPRVLGIESVYRGNNMMLLNIFGITSTNFNFFVAFALLYSKHKSGFGWALRTLREAMADKGVAMPDVIILSEVKEVALIKAIDDVFSSAKLLLYTLGIDDHVSNYCSKIFDVNDIGGLNSFKGMWHLLVESPTEAAFEQQLMQLRTEFSMYPEALAYVTNTWLKPYKERFVAAWTDNIMHFGYTDIICWDPTYGRLIFMYSSYCKGSTVIEQTIIDTFWKDLYTSHENYHTRIKASFVESSTNECKKYENPEFRELCGVVSIFALKKILGQTMLIDKKDTCHSVCSCAMKRTHGLPCAHEIAKYKRKGRPIPLDCIHPFWKKLDVEPLRRTAESAVDKRMKRRRLSKKINSTPSAPHLSEIVESQQRNSPKAGLSIVHSKQEKQPEAEEKVCDIQPTKQLEFEYVCPLVLRPYISNVKDVARDGHCGFRAVASFMGYSDEVGWLKVRDDLRNELMFYSDHYAQLFGSEERVGELLDALACSESPCPEKKHWMIMPEMGHIIASCYNVVLLHLSYVQCFTFFPLRTAPISMSVSSPIEIAIGLVDEHFVQVFLKPGHPMPPTVPALTRKKRTRWDEFHEQRSTEWATPYTGRIEKFKPSQPVVVKQKNQNVIDLHHVPSVDNMDVFFDSLRTV